GDQIVDIDLLVHVPIDDLRYVGATPGAAESGPLPDAAGHQLERPGRDLLAGARDTDDDRDAPALVAAFERLAHGLHIADAFEAVISAPLGQVDEVGDEIALDFLRIDEMRHAEFFPQRLAARV